jgi:hypothetical protein
MLPNLPTAKEYAEIEETLREFILNWDTLPRRDRDLMVYEKWRLDQGAGDEQRGCG